MTEEFIWHIWKFRLFDHSDLRTTSGESIRVLKAGTQNTDSGPDFFNARVRIGGMEWAGNVEIHTRASDWHKHRHTSDKAYDNIILHVVHEADMKIFRKNREEIPTLELKNKFPQEVYGKYVQFKSSRDWIPCEKQILKVDKFTLNNCLDRMLAERLERKSKAVLALLKKNKNNWEETFYQMLARNFGQKVNSDPFELLSKALPASILAKHKSSLIQTEALLFGAAGLLENRFRGEYPKQLQKEFHFLKAKFRISSIDSSLWKFMRLHPPSFPTIRISQFAALIHRSVHLSTQVLEAGSVRQVTALLETDTSEYWKRHYRFEKPSRKRNKPLGNSTINSIMINTVVPFLFVHGKEKGEEKYCDRALSFLENLEPENNSIITRWRSAGILAKNAYETQALLQLKNEHCANKKCLGCGVGNALLK